MSWLTRLNSKKGTIGMLINDPTIGRKMTQMTADLQAVTGAISAGKGSLGKLVNDDTLYTRANTAVDKLGPDHHRSERRQRHRRQAAEGRHAL